MRNGLDPLEFARLILEKHETPLLDPSNSFRPFGDSYCEIGIEWPEKPSTEFLSATCLYDANGINCQLCEGIVTQCLREAGENAKKAKQAFTTDDRILPAVKVRVAKNEDRNIEFSATPTLVWRRAAA